MYVLRQVFLHFLHTLVYGIGNLNVVGTRLRDYYNTHHRDAVHLHITFDVCRTKFGAAYVTESDNTVAVLFQNEVVELFCRMHQSERADGELNGISFDTTRWKFHIFAVYSVLYVDRGNAITGHFDRVEPQAHGVTFLSPDTYATYIGDCLKLFFYSKVGYFTQLQ